MRAFVLLALLIAVGCSDPEPRGDTYPSANVHEPLTVGEERARIAHASGAAATMRTGTEVPARLPPGFTVYPGAKITASTVVEKAGQRRMLLVFDTVHSVAQVIAFYRAEAQAAGATLSLDLGSEERASLGGRLKGGGEFAIAARQTASGARVQFFAS